MFNSYIGILLWCGIVALLAQSKNFKETIWDNGKMVRRYRKGFSVLVFVPLIIMVANRGWIGDTEAYARNYINAPSTFSALSEYIATISKDKGFYMLTAILRIILGSNYKVYFFAIAVLQSYFLIKIYRRYSVNYALSFFLFIVSTDYISWMYNGIRQFTAVTIAFGAFGLMVKKKYVRAVIVIFIASLFHGTALIMLPFVLVCHGKAWNKKTVLFLIGAIIAVAFVDKFTNILDVALEGTQYQNSIATYTVGELKGDDGTHPLRVLVYSVPAIISFFKRRRIQEENDVVVNVCTNMSTVAMGLYLISMVTSGILFGRLPIYFSLYSYILLPWEIEHMFLNESRKIVYLVMVSCYLFYYYYQMHVGFGII